MKTKNEERRKKKHRILNGVVSKTDQRRKRRQEIRVYFGKSMLRCSIGVCVCVYVSTMQAEIAP